MFWRLSGTEFQDVRGPIDTSSPRPAELRSDGDQFSYRREYSLDQKTQTVSYVQNEIERIASVVIAIDRIAIFFDSGRAGRFIAFDQVHVDLTRSSAIAEEPRDGSCHATVQKVLVRQNRSVDRALRSVRKLQWSSVGARRYCQLS